MVFPSLFPGKLDYAFPAFRTCLLSAGFIRTFQGVAFHVGLFTPSCPWPSLMSLPPFGLHNGHQVACVCVCVMCAVCVCRELHLRLSVSPPFCVVFSRYCKWAWRKEREDLKWRRRRKRRRWDTCSQAWQREPQACTHCIVRHIKTLGPSDTFFVCVW